ncbi:hypothetical protein WA026_023841 [Henosepilachna vigintioctopunctata]|uniref:Uncharacterized protein n=1 Tax=Henosepilachna vigintioctopunctata TaxID=420089 RepID=A0AAW1UX24_9CUCU
MDKLLFGFTLEAAADGKSNVIAITSIGTQEDKKFRIKISNFTKVKKSLKTINRTRNVWVALNEEMKEEYFDDYGNQKFNDEYLEEINAIYDTPSVTQKVQWHLY